MTAKQKQRTFITFQHLKLIICLRISNSHRNAPLTIQRMFIVLTGKKKQVVSAAQNPPVKAFGFVVAFFKSPFLPFM